MPFLDIFVFREDDHFNTSIYRKNTFTGLGSNYYSSCYMNFKLNALSTLLHRAITLTSNWHTFNTEIEYLHNFFKNNCFPSDLFYKHVNKVLQNLFIPIFKTPTVPKLKIYATIPYLMESEFRIKLKQIISIHI